MAVKVSKEIQNNVDKIEKETFKQLKDFQKKTVERVSHLFANNHNRVLVADEVGLGKTLIAKGVIAKTAKIRIQEGDDLFKVVYICSNQAIARQNIKTLDVASILPEYADSETDVSDTRLSMQHLTITKQENDRNIKNRYIQIIPLTPGTSFEISEGAGNVNERALMFAVLRRLNKFSQYQKQLEKILIFGADAAWDSWAKDRYEKEVEKLEISTGRKYPYNYLSELRKENIEIDGKERKLIDFIYKKLKYCEQNNCTKRKCSRCSKADKIKCGRFEIVSKLRIAFAKISTQKLNPDLVIMDEFQRFNSLIDENNSEYSGELARRFLKENPDSNDTKTRVLLLSATPYKMYSTMEECDENPADNPYEEFFTVMNFLFTENKKEFQETWENYVQSLKNAQKNGFEILKAGKMKAENAMYQGVCRTERLPVMNDNDFIDDSSKNAHLQIKEGDIASYIQMQEILNDMELLQTVPVDYVKSCPYLMSFMDKYKLKDNIKKTLSEESDFSLLDKPDVWLNKNDIENYNEIPSNNARLELLKEKVFADNAEKLLWVPPCRPYYELQGVYKNTKYFSKTLVFSSWEMVPRMISTLVSYEAERRIYNRSNFEF